MNLYDVALSTYESSNGRPERHACCRAVLRDQIATRTLDELMRCIERIEADEADDADELNCELRAELDLMRRRVRQLMLH
jgi:hypothetical protein